MISRESRPGVRSGGQGSSHLPPFVRPTRRPRCWATRSNSMCAGATGTAAPAPRAFDRSIAFNEIQRPQPYGHGALSAALGRYRDLLTRLSLEAIFKSRPLAVPTTEPAVDLVLTPSISRRSPRPPNSKRGGWALGLIVPVILVLDDHHRGDLPGDRLTAGERERGRWRPAGHAVPWLHLVTASSSCRDHRSAGRAGQRPERWGTMPSAA